MTKFAKRIFTAETLRRRELRKSKPESAEVAEGAEGSAVAMGLPAVELTPKGESQRGVRLANASFRRTAIALPSAFSASSALSGFDFVFLSVSASQR
jgi:hypothetical protein